MPITRILQSISGIEIGKIGEILEKRSGEKATDPKAGNRFQTRLAKLHRAQEILREWARESNPKSTQQRDTLSDFLRTF